MKYISGDFNPPFQIDHDEISVSARQNRALFWIQSKDPGGIFAGHLRKTLHGETSPVNTFAEQHGKQSFDPGRKAADRRPDIAGFHGPTTSRVSHVIAADAIDGS